MRPKAVITYGNPRVSEEKVTTKFTLYGDTDATKVQHQKYTEASDYELIKAHRALWSMIDDNELLPNNQDTPVRTPRRTRTAQENIIETFMPELPDDPDERRVEVNKRLQYKKQSGRWPSGQPGTFMMMMLQQKHSQQQWRKKGRHGTTKRQEEDSC